MGPAGRHGVLGGVQLSVRVLEADVVVVAERLDPALHDRDLGLPVRCVVHEPAGGQLAELRCAGEHRRLARVVPPLVELDERGVRRAAAAQPHAAAELGIGRERARQPGPAHRPQRRDRLDSLVQVEVVLGAEGVHEPDQVLVATDPRQQHPVRRPLEPEPRAERVVVVAREQSRLRGDHRGRWRIPGAAPDEAAPGEHERVQLRPCGPVRRIRIRLLEGAVADELVHLEPGVVHHQQVPVERRRDRGQAQDPQALLVVVVAALQVEAVHAVGERPQRHRVRSRRVGRGPVDVVELVRAQRLVVDVAVHHPAEELDVGARHRRRIPVDGDVHLGRDLDRDLAQRVGRVAGALVREIDELVEEADERTVRARVAGLELQYVRVEREHRRVGAGLVEADEREQIVLAGREVRELDELRVRGRRVPARPARRRFPPPQRVRV